VGSLKEVYSENFQAGLSAMERCLPKGFREKDRMSRGEATFQLAIDSSGRVTKVGSLVSSKLNDKNLEQCLIQKVKELTFPTPEGAEKVNVTVNTYSKMFLNFKFTLKRTLPSCPFSGREGFKETDQGRSSIDILFFRQ